MTTMETNVTTAQVYQLYIEVTKPEFVKQYFHGALVESTYEGCAPKRAANVNGGWMLILSGLKTLCETGKPLLA